MPAKRGRPSNAEVAERIGERLRADTGGCSWYRADGRVLMMPWTLDALWARLHREVDAGTMPSDRDPAWKTFDAITEAIAAARAEGFRDGIERAAQACRFDRHSEPPEEAFRKLGRIGVAAAEAAYEVACEECAAAIRALAPVPDRPAMETLREIGALPGMQEALAKATDPRGSVRAGGGDAAEVLRALYDAGYWTIAGGINRDEQEALWLRAKKVLASQPERSGGEGGR